ncbi:MAG TPA: efflux RND transporter periplasmic adaptor subunit [Acidobacteriaceae bacterium]|nr:efflux RND transporter periplasmic adaptor subunit [Acidobacteriaceae bacterium]
MRFFPKCMPPFEAICLAAVLAIASGCKQAAPPAAGPPPATPVQAATVVDSAVPSTETYVATIKSRRSATMQPQVDGNLTRIFVKSGDRVKAGQVLMQIDPLKQVATVQSQQGTEQQQKALYQFNKSDLARQKQLFDSGIISKQAYEQSLQAFQNSKGAFDSASALTNTQKQQLAYYQIRAPFAGIVGDIPVHLGDYVSPTTMLTTVDENNDLEAYIYLPTERAAQVHNGLAVDLLDNSGTVLAHSTIDFVSPEVDNGLQSVLAKASVPASSHLRNGQLVNARVTFSTNRQPTVPVLAVVRIGGQSFVYVAAPNPKGGFVAHQAAVNLGEPVGNVYPVLSGLKPGDRVILSGIQFLQEGVPVQPLSPQPAAPPS